MGGLATQQVTQTGWEESDQDAMMLDSAGGARMGAPVEVSRVEVSAVQRESSPGRRTTCGAARSVAS